MKIHKLNATGVAHHFLIALVAVTLVASFGAYRVFFSKASTNSAFSYAGVDSNALFDVTTEGGCWLAGRKWQPAHTAKVKNKAGKVVRDKKGNAKTKQVPAGCSKVCRYGDGKDIASTAKGVQYCKKAIDLIDPVKCVNEYHRRFVSEVGCTKRVADVSLNNSAHCNSPNSNYVREEGVSSNCVAETVEVPAGKAKSQEQVSQETTPAGEPVQSKPPKNLKEAKKKKKSVFKRAKQVVTGNKSSGSQSSSSGSITSEMIAKCHKKGYLALSNGCSTSCYTAGGFTKSKNGKCEKGITVVHRSAGSPAPKSKKPVVTSQVMQNSGRPGSYSGEFSQWWGFLRGKELLKLEASCKKNLNGKFSYTQSGSNGMNVKYKCTYTNR